MMDLTWAMASIVGTWVVLGATLVGLGLLVGRALRDTGRIDADRIAVAFWIGYAGAVALLQVLSFVVPMGAGVLAGLVAAGLSGLLLRARDLRRWAAGAIRRRPRAAALILLAGVLVANQAIGRGDASDSGLYHYQTIAWAGAFPVVPGLANLSVLYGVNPSSLLFAAALDSGPWEGRVEHVANGLLVWALLALAVLSISRLLSRGREGRPVARRPGEAIRDVYGAMLLPPAVFLLYSKEVCSPRTDLPAGVVMLLVGWRLLALLEPPPEAPEARRGDLLAVTALCALAVCLKLSAGFFALFSWALAAGAWWLARDRPRSVRAGGLAVAALVSALLVGPWMGRHIVLSGYPLFPDPHLSLPVDWRLPREKALWFADAVERHGKGVLPVWMVEYVERTPLRWYAPLMKAPFERWDQIEGWEWVRPWFFSLPVGSPNEVIVPALLVLGAWGAVVRGRRRGAAGGPIGRGAWVLLPAGLALLLWFLLKPVPRFAYGITWSAAAASVALAVRAWAPSPGRRAAFLVAGLAAAAAVPAVAYRAAVVAALYDESPWSQIPFRGPGEDRGFHPRRASACEPWTTRRGLTINRPADGGELCWDCPLPCAGYPPPDPDLRLRREGDLSRGFVIERD